MVKKLCVIPKNLPSEIIYIIYIITLLTPVILNTCWFFLLIYLFPCIFININITCGHSVNKKKKYFGCLHHHRYIQNDSDDSSHPILPYCIQCSRILKPLRIPRLTHFHQPLCHFNIYSPQSTSSANIQSSFL